MQALKSQQIWQILEQVKDPEIPVVSVVEMGLIRQVALNENAVVIRMTPTFAGCPALQVMKSEIETRLQQAGAANIQVQITLSPPWTSDWITTGARKKLKAFGLAPPPQHGGDFERLLQETATCPYCDSQNTQLKNDFGPTLCRAIYVCQDCKQPFEQFKPV